MVKWGARLAFATCWCRAHGRCRPVCVPRTLAPCPLHDMFREGVHVGGLGGGSVGCGGPRWHGSLWPRDDHSHRRPLLFFLGLVVGGKGQGTSPQNRTCHARGRPLFPPTAPVPQHVADVPQRGLAPGGGPVRERPRVPCWVLTTCPPCSLLAGRDVCRPNNNAAARFPGPALTSLGTGSCPIPPPFVLTPIVALVCLFVGWSRCGWGGRWDGLLTSRSGRLPFFALPNAFFCFVCSIVPSTLARAWCWPGVVDGPVVSHSSAPHPFSLCV
jgi:hypothetical protein